MTGWSNVLQGLVGRADAAGDVLRRRLGGRSRGTPLIVPYIGWGDGRRLLVAGRVLRDPGFVRPDAGARAWANVREFYRRLESDEVAHARVVARFQGETHALRADDEGYLALELALHAPLPAGPWHEVELQALAPASAPVRAPVLVPPPTARCLVVSDLDDTVVQSHVHDRLKMLWTLMRSNAHTRKPFAGVAALYRALHDGAGGGEANPLFYVSSSPWNLSTPLVDFLERQGIPLGPLLLKDYGDHTLFQASDHRGHKLAAIERLFAFYPALPVVLLGDSSEQDPEIYAELVHRHPGRVRAVYIRDAGADAARAAAIDHLVAEVAASGAQLVLARDSAAAAAHAAGQGWIAADRLAEIRAEVRADTGGAHRPQGG